MRLTSWKAKKYSNDKSLGAPQGRCREFTNIGKIKIVNQTVG